MHAMILTYIAQYVFLKLSLAYQFLRLLFTTWERSIIYSAVFVTTVIGTSHLFFILFLCGLPQHYALFLFTQPQRCHTVKEDIIFHYFQVASSVTFDVIAVALPLRHVLTSRTMNLRTKTTVSFILLLFVGGLAASIVKLVRLTDVYNTPVLQKVTIGGLVFFLEGGLFIMGGCLGTLRPLVVKTLEKSPRTYASGNMSQDSRILIESTHGSRWDKLPALPPLNEYSV
jgi:hypothetical protein